MSLETIYLIEVTDSTAAVHRYCSGIGYTSLPSDTPANAHYEPRVEQPGLFRQNMFAVGTTSGNSTGGYGEIVLMNTDGGLDGFVDLGLDGQLCVVKQGNPGTALSTFAAVITGTVEQCEISWNRVTLRLKDKTIILSTPVQPTHYLGNNSLPAGIEGVADLKDKPMPRLYGKCNNVTPICVNTSLLIYQLHDAALNAISGVYDNGVGLVFGADRADNAALQATAPASGGFDTCLAEGLFRLGSTPAGTITADAVQGAAAANRTAGQIIKSLAVEKLGAAYIVEQSIIDLDKAAPYVVGVYTGGEDKTTTEILDMLCGSVGAWWGFDNLGNFWAKQLTAPVSTQSVMTLTQAEILSIDRTATADGDKGVPVWRVNIDFSRNWTVQNSGLAGSVNNNQLTFEPGNGTQLTTDRRALLAMQYIRTKAEDAAVKTTHMLAPEIIVPTTLDALADANTEAARVLALRKVRRDRLQVKVAAKAIQYPDGGYWDDEAISELLATRYNHTSVVYNNWLYIIGGIVNGSNTSTSVVRLNLNSPTSSWDDSGVSDLPFSVYESSAVVYNGKIYLVAGRSSIGFLISIMSLDLSNPAGGWTQNAITNRTLAVRGHSCAVVGSTLFLFGGYIGSGSSGSNTADSFDLSNPSGTWNTSTVAMYPILAAGISLITSGNYIYGMGGIKSGGAVSNACYRFDANNPTVAWDTAPIPDLPNNVHGAAAVIINSIIYLIGGLFSSSAASVTTRVSSWGIGDPIWNTLTPLTDARGYAIAASNNDDIYLMGGYTTGTVPIPTTFRFRRNLNPVDISQLTGLGRTVLVKHPRYGYTSGRAMKIIGTESDLKNRLMTLELWG